MSATSKYIETFPKIGVKNICLVLIQVAIA